MRIKLKKIQMNKVSKKMMFLTKVQVNIVLIQILDKKKMKINKKQMIKHKKKKSYRLDKKLENRKFKE